MGYEIPKFVNVYFTYSKRSREVDQRGDTDGYLANVGEATGACVRAGVAAGHVAGSLVRVCGWPVVINREACCYKFNGII